MLANVEFKFPPLPKGPFAPAPPHVALPGPKVSGLPGLSYPPGEWSVRLWGLRDLGFHAGSIQISQQQTTAWHLPVFSLLK